MRIRRTKSASVCPSATEAAWSCDTATSTFAAAASEVGFVPDLALKIRVETESPWQQADMDRVPELSCHCVPGASTSTPGTKQHIAPGQTNESRS